MTEHVSQAKLVRIDPSTLIIEDNVRQAEGLDIDSLAELGDSIATHGLMQPVIVEQHGDGLRLVAGERRVIAAQIAGIGMIDAIVQPATTGAERVTRQLIENLHRVDLSMIEQARAVRILYDEHHSLTLVADMIGKPKSWTCKALALTADAGGIVARAMLEQDVTGDLEIAYLLTQLEALLGVPATAKIAAGLRTGDETRATLRQRLADLKAGTVDDENDDENDDEARTSTPDKTKSRALELTAEEAGMLHQALSQAIAAPDLAHTRLSLLARLATLKV